MTDAARWSARTWAALAGLVAIRASVGFQFHAAAVIAPLLLAERGWSNTQLGWLVGGYMIPAVLLSFPGGVLAQRIGDRPVLLVSTALMAAGGALTAWADGFAWAMAGRLIAGIGGALVQILMLKLTAERFLGPRLATATGTVLTSWPLGIALALAVLGAIAAAGGARLALAGAALAAVIAGVALAVGWQPLTGTPARRPAPPAPEATARGATAKGATAKGATAKGATAKGATAAAAEAARFLPAERRVVMGASIAWGLFNGSLTAFLAFCAPWLVALGQPLAPAAFAVSLAGWALAVLTPFGGAVTDRLRSTDATVIGGGLATALAIAALPLTGPSVVLIVVVGALMALPPGAMAGVLATAVPAQRRARAFGVYGSCAGAGTVAGPAGAGWLVDLSGAAVAPLWWATALMIASVLVFVLRARRPR